MFSIKDAISAWDKFLGKDYLGRKVTSYLGVIYFAGVPESNTLNLQKETAFALGIWPSWSMFAPNPVRFDSKTFVEITQNGEVIEKDVEIEPKGLMAPPFREARWS